MQFVAASKLKRAQDATLAARPYSEKLDEVLADLASVLGGEDHPLLGDPPRAASAWSCSSRRTARCPGPLNTNIVRFVAGDIIDKPTTRPDHRRPQGPRAMRRAGVPIEAHFATFGDRPTFADVLPLARLVTDDFLARTYTRVDVVFSRFVSTPVQRPENAHDPADRAVRGHRGHPRQPVHLRTERLGRAGATPPAVRRDTPVSGRPRGEGERGVQPMVAMKNATENAEDLIEDLTDPLQQGPPVEYHPRDDRDRVRADAR